jgi:hypothetical protein
VQVPVEENSLPLHLIGKEPRETEEAVAQFVAARPELWQLYGGWLATLHPEAYRGVLSMAKGTKEKFDFDLESLVETMGLDWVIQKLGVERVIGQLPVEQICAALTPRQRQQLKRLLDKGRTPPEVP